MSARRFKEMRGLAEHIEYGGYYPAMHKSGLRLREMAPTPKQQRRLDVMAERRFAKRRRSDQRWEEAGQPEEW